ncbi:MAG TPA: UDP-N-acetylglucosamine 2-epimerase [Gemmatimonadales bacterium]|jgi:UDP-N-acetylglucosamine 2-epimerase (non-hydrolysing)
MRILSVVGAPSDVLHLAPVARALAGRSEVTHHVVHAGAPAGPAAALLAELGMPAPDHHLEVGRGAPGARTGLIMQRLEPLLTDLRPDVVLVFGADDAAVAAALVAAKLGCRVGHIGAGLRSGEATTPQEINRVVIDRVAELLLAPSRQAMENLKGEAVPEERADFVGNALIDTAFRMLPPTQDAAEPYAVVALHDPANVDDAATLETLLSTLTELAHRVPIVLLADADLRERVRAVEGGRGLPGLTVIEPPGYAEMLGLVASAALVITDTATLQDETTYLGVPCLTLRTATECAASCCHGTNRLVPPARAVLLAAATRALARWAVRLARPVVERWDGRAAERIVAVVCDGARFPLEPPPVASPDPDARPRRRAVAMREPALIG